MRVRCDRWQSCRVLFLVVIDSSVVRSSLVAFRAQLLLFTFQVAMFNDFANIRLSLGSHIKYLRGIDGCLSRLLLHDFGIFNSFFDIFTLILNWRPARKFMIPMCKQTSISILAFSCLSEVLAAFILLPCRQHTAGGGLRHDWIGNQCLGSDLYIFRDWRIRCALDRKGSDRRLILNFILGCRRAHLLKLFLSMLQLWRPFWCLWSSWQAILHFESLSWCV